MRRLAFWVSSGITGPVAGAPTNLLLEMGLTVGPLRGDQAC